MKKAEGGRLATQGASAPLRRFMTYSVRKGSCRQSGALCREARGDSNKYPRPFPAVAIERIRLASGTASRATASAHFETRRVCPRVGPHESDEVVARIIAEEMTPRTPPSRAAPRLLYGKRHGPSGQATLWRWAVWGLGFGHRRSSPGP